MQPTLLTRYRQSSTGWNTRVSGCSSSIMPMHPNCSKPTTRVHPEVTSCSPREHSSSTRWALPGHSRSRRWIQRKRWTFSSNARNAPRATRQRSNAAEQLAAELGYLPLALEQAAAYIIAKGSTLSRLSRQLPAAAPGPAQQSTTQRQASTRHR